MKNILILVVLMILVSSCADSQSFVIDGKSVEVEPYGWANKDTKYNENVIYEVSLGNVVWSIIGFETVILPVWLTGWELFEPVKLKDVKTTENK